MNASNFKKAGFNLFSSTKVSELPEELKKSLGAENIVNDNEYTLCLLASGGKELWSHLPLPLKAADHPIDNYSIGEILKFDPEAVILFPHNDLTIPLQKLGRFFNLSRASLLGLDINNEFGVWFAFRGVFLTKKTIEKNIYPEFISPCESCVDKPCISACPAGAVSETQGLGIKACAQYRLSLNNNCADKCISRMSCPYKAHHQYDLEQIRYHMTRTDHLIKLSDYAK